MLSPESAESLVSILSSSTTQLSDLLAQFSTQFDIKNRVICLKNISLFLADGILDHPQQIVAFWLLYKSFEIEDIDEHPFRPLFSYIYSDFRTGRPNTCSPELLTILSNLLTKNDISIIGNLTVDQIMGPDFPLKPFSVTEVPGSKLHFTRISPVLIDNLNQNSQNANNDSQQYLAISSSPSLSGISMSASPSTPTIPIISQNELLKSLLLNPSYSNEFEAPYIRPTPELSPIFEQEVEQSFVISDFDIPMLYDNNKI